MRASFWNSIPARWQSGETKRRSATSCGITPWAFQVAWNGQGLKRTPTLCVETLPHTVSAKQLSSSTKWGKKALVDEGLGWMDEVGLRMAVKDSRNLRCQGGFMPPMLLLLKKN